jgi:hypothetical protein
VKNVIKIAFFAQRALSKLESMLFPENICNFREKYGISGKLCGMSGKFFSHLRKKCGICGKFFWSFMFFKKIVFKKVLKSFRRVLKGKIV